MFKTFLRDESGASAAEYALILAVVGAGIAGAAYWLGESVQTSVDGATLEVDACQPGPDGVEADCAATSADPRL